MVNNKTSSQTERELNLVFRALADPTRRKILRQLASRPSSVGDLADPFSQSLPAISKHLKVLEEASLVRRKRRGRSYELKLSAKPLRNASEFIAFYERFWNNKLQQLDAYLRKQP